MGQGNDGTSAGLIDEVEERVSRSLVRMYEVRSALGSSKSMGSYEHLAAFATVSFTLTS